MPNIFHNTITISGPEEVVQMFMSTLKGGENSPFLTALIPPPEDASDEWFETNWCNTREGHVLGDWEKVGENTFSLNVDTAWGAPYEVLVKVSELYPLLQIKMVCCSGESLACGYAIIKNGIDTESVYWSYGRENTDEAKEYARGVFGKAFVDEGKFYEEG